MGASVPERARAASVTALKHLLVLHERGDQQGFDHALASFSRHGDDALFTRVAKLTRQLHTAMKEVQLDDQLARLAGDEIPDARARLTHVVTMTESAAHRTLDLVDEARHVPAAIERHARQLADVEAILHAADPDIACIGAVLGGAREGLSGHAGALRETLSQLAMAQEYQDLAGQMIKRVISLVINVENALIELLKVAGQPLIGPSPHTADQLLGPAIPTDHAATQQDADDVLADLGF